jgi:hypothetical protein
MARTVALHRNTVSINQKPNSMNETLYEKLNKIYTFTEIEHRPEIQKNK